jgi:alpha-ketoglutarate-dependent 2,4-dichlorophenoxyacetate dioxygenase
MRSITINEQWHTDSSFRETPAAFSIFAAVEIPPEGGETWYASLRRGWEALDSETRDALEGLRAKHDYREAYRRAGAGEAFEGMGSALEHWHPLIRRHPETGARALFVTGHAFEVEGMQVAEGRALVESLVAFCTEEERVYRHRWRPGDVLIWDNRSMLHRAQGFEERHRRVMHHVRVAGAAPVAT